MTVIWWRHRVAADCDPKPRKCRAPTGSLFGRRLYTASENSRRTEEMRLWQLKFSERRPRCTVQTSNISQFAETGAGNKKVKIKVKVSLQHALKVQWRRRCIALLCPNHGARWRWTVNATLWPLYLREEPHYPLGWPQGRSGRSLVKIQSLSLTRVRTPNRTDRSDMLFQLSYPDPICG